MATATSRIVLPRRLRLVKLLRAHGLRHAERLREDELKAALEKLPLASPETLSSPAPRVPPPRQWAASSDVMPRREGRPAPEPAPPAVVDDRWDDPHAEPRFREPKVRLPEGDRTFVRLIAVDPERLLVTWDLDATARAKTTPRMQLVLHLLDEEGARPSFHDVDLLPGRWYLAAPAERSSVQVDLINQEGEILGRSNAAIVPPAHPAPAGALVYATLPTQLDRRLLADRDLLAEGVELPKGAEVTHVGVSEPRGPTPSRRMPTSADGRSTDTSVQLRNAGAVPAVSTTALPSSHTRASSHSSGRSSSLSASSSTVAGTPA